MTQFVEYKTRDLEDEVLLERLQKSLEIFQEVKILSNQAVLVSCKSYEKALSTLRCFNHIKNSRENHPNKEFAAEIESGPMQIGVSCLRADIQVFIQESKIALTVPKAKYAIALLATALALTNIREKQ